MVKCISTISSLLVALLLVFASAGSQGSAICCGTPDASSESRCESSTEEFAGRLTGTVAITVFQHAVQARRGSQPLHQESPSAFLHRAHTSVGLGISPMRARLALSTIILRV
jgi:hypothetical protein